MTFDKCTVRLQTSYYRSPHETTLAWLLKISKSTALLSLYSSNDISRTESASKNGLETIIHFCTVTCLTRI